MIICQHIFGPGELIGEEKDGKQPLIKLNLWDIQLQYMMIQVMPDNLHIANLNSFSGKRKSFSTSSGAWRLIPGTGPPHIF